MNRELVIREHNKQAHVDIEHDIQEKKNGLFTFILRINNGNIVDYNVVEYVDTRKYFSVTHVIVQELNITHDNRE